LVTISSRHRPARVLQPEQPAQEHHVGQARGGAEQTDADVAGELGADPRGRLEQQQGGPDDEWPRRDQQQGDQRPEHERPDQAGAQLGGIGATESLRGEPGGAHAQEAEHEIENVERKRAERHRPKVMGLGQMADHRRVDDAEQRHGEIGQNQRPGESPRFAVQVRRGVRIRPSGRHGRRSAGFMPLLRALSW
jgi:hypothetical protein